MKTVTLAHTKVQYIFDPPIDTCDKSIMELRQLRYFVAVAEEGHFGRAANRLRMSQPPVSMQIKGLEEELGVELLDRKTRRVALTDAGAAFLEKARKILGLIEEAKREAKGANLGVAGRLEVGFVSSATLTVLPHALKSFGERFGGVELVLEELASASQADALYSGRIRVGLVRLPLRAPGIAVEPVFGEDLIVALPMGHRLETLGQVPVEKLADVPLIFVPRRLMPGFHDQVVGLFRDVGVLPKVVQHAVQQETIVGLVAGGVGAAILPGSVARVRRDGVVYRPLDAQGTTTWLGLARLETDSSVLVENFANSVREAARAETPPGPRDAHPTS